jgi:hypothetical protein
MKLLATVSLFLAAALTADAHHGLWDIQVPSPKCGWLEGSSVRDIQNLTDFCTRWVPGNFRVAAAAANRERLWIEAQPQLVNALRVDGEATRVLLKEWLERWRATSGYRSASVVVLRGHVPVATAEATVAGDAIAIR